MTSSPTDEMIAQITAQSAAKRDEFLDAGAKAFKESEVGQAHAKRVAAEREARAAKEVHFTEAEFFMLEAATQSGFNFLEGVDGPEMIADFASVVVFGLHSRRAERLAINPDTSVSDLDKRIEELSH